MGTYRKLHLGIADGVGFGGIDDTYSIANN
jgi:hypothetical protein